MDVSDFCTYKSHIFVDIKRYILFYKRKIVVGGEITEYLTTNYLSAKVCGLMLK